MAAIDPVGRAAPLSRSINGLFYFGKAGEAIRTPDPALASCNRARSGGAPPSRLVEEIHDRRERRPVLDDENVAAVEELQSGARDTGGHPLLGLGFGDAVVTAGGDEGGVSDVRQTLPRVVGCAGFELAPRARGVTGFVCVGIRRGHGDELRVPIRVGLGPDVVAAGIGNRDPAHQAEAGRVVQDIEDCGLEAVRESRVLTPNGAKGSRYVDVAARDTKTGDVIERHQVGRQTQSGKPVSRERKSMDDIEGATGARPIFHPYN